jgi:hypothetical protein
MIAKHPGDCKPHAYQDKTYGPGFRVMNPVKEQGKIVGARCTVCCPPKAKMSKRGGVYLVGQLQIKRS